MTTAPTTFRWSVRLVDVAALLDGRPVIRRRAAFCLEGHVWTVPRALVDDDPSGGGTWVVGAHGKAMPRPDRTGVLLLGSARLARTLVECLVRKGLRDPNQVRKPHQLAQVLRYVDRFMAEPVGPT